MAAEIDFQPYLYSISTHYDHWWELYTLTDAQTKAQQQNGPQPWKTPFEFMVQTVNRDHSLASDAPGLEPQSSKEKIERFPVLQGIRKSVKEHRQVLLVGATGFGEIDDVGTVVVGRSAWVSSGFVRSHCHKPIQ